VQAIDHASVIVRLRPVLHDRVSSTPDRPGWPSGVLGWPFAPIRHCHRSMCVYDRTGEESSKRELRASAAGAPFGGLL
jgi:hypothetical protein